ncbi:MAG: hypothetical protein C5B47_04365 [Verrucomicrobia bacterium]|nr:MAG: hypothetical protein C5B47_04365 [Verrucomicrobiota bacterium]
MRSIGSVGRIFFYIFSALTAEIQRHFFRKVFLPTPHPACHGADKFHQLPLYFFYFIFLHDLSRRKPQTLTPAKPNEGVLNNYMLQEIAVRLPAFLPQVRQRPNLATTCNYY